MGQITTIALDVMSGDCGPRSRICAAQDALTRHPHLHLVLVGDSRFIREHLSREVSDRVTVVHAAQTVSMDERPSRALRSKQDSSMWLAVEQVAMGMSQACVSAGNTGALMAMGRHLLKTFPGIDRPALVGQVPTSAGGTLLLDLGANVDCSADLLFQFAVLGSLLKSEVYDVVNPSVGLLNVGEEDIKGSETVRLAQQLIESHESLNYAGFIEGDDLYSGRVDVVVCDGFAGNVALKASEAAVRMVAHKLAAGVGLNSWQKVLLKLLKPLFKPMAASIDPGRYNGAMLLGLQGIVVKSHGAADARQFGFAIDQAVRAVEHNAVHRINERLEELL
ncbi:phosphate acyltransferase PlsX [Parendozoicomonas haliclonae]|uniref:Phosphate acyltransferase n=1 Tax=Parendozoicomonas haliclonae TaxID=1960125 RepID=A0A1X7AMK8_9GAMM|nr:phosphate acyltransferase PlsX [Parendozoicomonas haliclonae]SMA49165.1 Phosphate acyltransferase [Parendozoicomonas haliclonae]